MLGIFFQLHITCYLKKNTQMKPHWLTSAKTRNQMQVQLNLVDSKSSGPRKILRNTEASDKQITNIHVYLSEKYFSCKKYVETENTFEL